MYPQTCLFGTGLFWADCFEKQQTQRSSANSVDCCPSGRDIYTCQGTLRSLGCLALCTRKRKNTAWQEMLVSERAPADICTTYDSLAPFSPCDTHALLPSSPQCPPPYFPFSWLQLKMVLKPVSRPVWGTPHSSPRPLRSLYVYTGIHVKKLVLGLILLLCLLLPGSQPRA